MPKVVNWENVKDDIQEYWPDYVNAAEINSKGYKNEESIQMLLEIMVQAGEVETDPNAANGDILYRANHGTPSELAEQAINHLNTVSKYFNKRYRLYPEIQAAVNFLVKLRKITSAEAEYFTPGYLGDAPERFRVQELSQKKKKKQDTSTKGMTEKEKVAKTPPDRGKIKVMLSIAEALSEIDGKTGSNAEIHTKLVNDGVDIALEQVQKGLTNMAARKYVKRLGNSSPATYKLQPAGERYIREASQ